MNGKRIVQLTGTAACMLALLGLAGGHWGLLQTVAWTRMVISFVESDALPVALSKTFDGKHPCAMCRAIVQGRQQQERDQRQSSWVQPQRMPDFLPVSAQPTVPPIPASPRVEIGFISRLYSDFIKSPPKPPPRLNTFML